MERKTGFEPATLTLARWWFSSRPSVSLPVVLFRPARFHLVRRVRPCSRAVHYRPKGLTRCGRSGRADRPAHNARSSRYAGMGALTPKASLEVLAGFARIANLNEREVQSTPGEPIPRFDTVKRRQSQSGDGTCVLRATGRWLHAEDCPGRSPRRRSPRRSGPRGVWGGGQEDDGKVAGRIVSIASFAVDQRPALIGCLECNRTNERRVAARFATPKRRNRGNEMPAIRRPAPGRMAVSFLSCLAVIGSLGGAMLLPRPAEAAPSQWVHMGTPNHNGEQNNVLSGVSCVSSTDCVAVGSHSTISNQRSKPLVESLNGNTWSIVHTPYPGSSTNVLQDVSCSSSTNCTAVGYYGNNAALQPLIEAWDGSMWSVSPSPSPGSIQNELLDVSCVSATSCVAVGFHEVQGAGEDVPQTLVESWDGATWSIEPSPNQSSGDNLLFSVSCSSTTSCNAVGYYWNGVAYQTLIESWDGASWSVVPSPNQNNEGPTLNNFLRSVSCVSSTSCMAVGFDYMNQFQNSQSLTESWDGTAWSLTASPNPGTDYNDVTGVSCSSAISCVAVGSYNNTSNEDPSADQTLIESWDGTDWSLTPSPNLKTTDNALSGVFCSGASSCVAAGHRGSTSGSLRTLILAGR